MSIKKNTLSKNTVYLKKNWWRKWEYS